MASVKTLAVRALELLIDQDYTNAEGWYLTPSEYEQTKDDIDALIDESEDSHDALARLVEAALAADDADLFYALYEHAGWDSFEHVMTEYFGLSSFFVYCSAACLTTYLDLHLEDPDTWAETCEERLFDELETDFWELDWAPSWRNNSLAILYLLHFKGGISAHSLLKKSIQHGFSAYYAPIRALGASFEVDDLYTTNHDIEDLRTLLSEGLMDTLKTDATTEDWVYLVEKLL
jgi:hypothetical protein